MKGKKIILIVLWTLAGIIGVASVISYLTLPHWKGIYIGGMGGFLVINLLIAIFFVSRNFKN